MTETSTFSMKRFFLFALIVSVLISAALGIIVIVAGSEGWAGLKVILTTLTISGASICGLACGAAYEQGRRVLPISGLISTLVGSFMLLAGIWLNTGSELGAKITYVSMVFGVAGSYLSLLSLARLAPRFAWSFFAALIVGYGMAGYTSLLVIVEEWPDGTVQIIGVASVIGGALSILIPIFHKLSQPELATSNIVAIDLEIARLEVRLLDLKEKRARFEASADKTETK